MRVTKYNTVLSEDRLPMLVKENSFNYQVEKKCLTSPNDIYWFMSEKENLDCQDHEITYILCFDTKCKLLGYFKVTEGTVNQSLLSPREVFIKALAVGAVKIILIHNHPSGNATPSNMDDEITKRIKEGGKLIGIALIDHLVFGSKKYFSYLESKEEFKEW